VNYGAPPSAQPYPPPVGRRPLRRPARRPAARRNGSGRRFWLTCLILLCLSCCGLLALGGGGYYLWSSGVIGQRQVLELLGRGFGETSVVNLGETPLSVKIERLDAGDTAAPLLETSLNLQPMDVDGFVVEPGRYRLDFQFSGGQPESCTLRIASGDFYQFAALAEGIVVANQRQPASSTTEMRIANSPLCKQ